MNIKKKNTLFGRYPSCDMLNNALRFIHEGKIDAACSEIIFAIEKANGYFHEDIMPIVEEARNYWQKHIKKEGKVEMKTKEQVQKEGLVAKCGGTVYTIEEFFEYVKDGSFIPYDGSGYFHDGERETTRSVWDTNLSLLELKKYPYVCWYNK